MVRTDCPRRGHIDLCHSRIVRLYHPPKYVGGGGGRVHHTPASVHHTPNRVHHTPASVHQWLVLSRLILSKPGRTTLLYSYFIL